MSGLGETVERQMVGSLKTINIKDHEPPSAEKRSKEYWNLICECIRESDLAC